jgi:hypothetical protein
MKIKTIEKLQDKLEEDLAWRKKEILSLKLLIEKDEINKKILLRAGVALLCAHFEGFIKTASNYYVIYISSKKVKCDNVLYSLLAIKLKKDFDNCSKTDNHSVHGLLLEKIEQIKNENFFIKYTDSEPIISTKSNPKSEVLDEILKTIGIKSDIFTTKKQYIDYSLLYNRNKIVHGERFELNYKDFDEVFNVVMDLLDKYKELIIQAAEKEEFLKNKYEVEYA